MVHKYAFQLRAKSAEEAKAAVEDKLGDTDMVGPNNTKAARAAVDALVDGLPIVEAGHEILVVVTGDAKDGEESLGVSVYVVPEEEAQH